MGSCSACSQAPPPVYVPEESSLTVRRSQLSPSFQEEKAHGLRCQLRNWNKPQASGSLHTVKGTCQRSPSPGMELPHSQEGSLPPPAPQ